MELKKPTTYSEQIELLIEKGVITDDPDLNVKFLSNVNYYFFSGYLLPFIDREANKCLSPITFQRLKNIYEFDAQLRNLIALTIEQIEVYLRNKISYYFAHHYGAEGYMDSCSYGEKHDHETFLKNINACKNSYRKTEIFKHHIEKYDGHFPVWVIIEFLPLGSLSYLFGDMKSNDKKAIAINDFGLNYKILESWLRCLTDLRNKCAHCSRLYFWIFSAVPKRVKNDKFKPDRRLFSQLYMLKHMYPNKELWNELFFDKLLQLIDHYKDDINLCHIGFPENWIELLRA